MPGRGLKDSPPHREGHARLRPDADLAAQLQIAAMKLHDRLNQRQAQPAPLVRPTERGINLLEGFEHAVEISRRDADAGIAYREYQSGLRVEPADNLDMAAPGGKFDSVGDEVEQDLLGLALIGAQQRQVCRQFDRL